MPVAEPGNSKKNNSVSSKDGGHRSNHTFPVRALAANSRWKVELVTNEITYYSCGLRFGFSWASVAFGSLFWPRAVALRCPGFLWEVRRSSFWVLWGSGAWAPLDF